MKAHDWKGAWVASVTLFKNNELDLASVKKFVAKLLAAGIQGICPAGTTGEGSSLTDQEFTTLVEKVLEVAGGKIPVVPGTGTNNTATTIQRTKLAKKLGATGALVVTPYYVKPTGAGLTRHYAEISDQVDLPLMLYNVPGRTGVNMLPETVAEICATANVAAIKDCAPLTQISYLVRSLGDKISIFSGEDPTFFPFLALGGVGIVSVAANIVPESIVQIYELFKKGNLDSSRKEFLRIVPLIDALFCESNPIPVKAAISMMGWGPDEIRSPLAPISDKGAALVKKELKELGLMK